MNHLTHNPTGTHRAAWQRTARRTAVVAGLLSAVFAGYVLIGHPGDNTEHWFRVTQCRDAWLDYLQALERWSVAAARQSAAGAFDPGSPELSQTWSRVTAGGNTIVQLQDRMGPDWVRFVHLRVMLPRKRPEVLAVVEQLKDTLRQPVDKTEGNATHPGLLPYTAWTTGTPADSQALKATRAALSAELAARPDDAELKRLIREADRDLRLRWMTRRRRWTLAWRSLVWALTVFALSVLGWIALKPVQPLLSPEAHPDDFATTSARLRGAVASAAAVLLVLAGMAAWAGRGVPGDYVIEESQPTSGGAPKPTVATWDQRKVQWPMFRGRGGWAVAYAENVPTDWDGPSGRNILWSADVPLPGKNSPIVWNDRIFVSGADKTTRQVYCYDLKTGKRLWTADVDAGGSMFDPPTVMEDTGYAAPTLATDGLRVFAIFANGDLAGFTMDGKALWSFNLDVPENMYGHSSSLAVVDNVLVVQMDQAADEGGKSAVFGFDTATGNELWKSSRQTGASWASPIVAPHDGKTVVVTSTYPNAYGTDAANGKQLWQAAVQTGDHDIGPSPAYADGIVYICNVRSSMAAIRLGGSGNITESHVAWKNDEPSLPNTSSPVAGGGLVFAFEDYGSATCMDASTGKVLWNKIIDAEFVASPILVGKTIYVTTRKGVTYLIAAETSYREIKQLTLGETVEATPAFIDGRIVMRGANKLYCIGGTP